MPDPGSLLEGFDLPLAPPSGSLLSQFELPTTRPAYTPIEDSAAESHVKYAQDSATFDNALIKDLGRGLSLWDEQLQATAKRTKPLALFTPEDHVGQITAFMSSRGLRFDEKAVNGERAAGVLETSDKAYTRFMVDSGLKDVATKDEGLQIRHAFLFMEVGRRSSLAPSEYDRAGAIAVDQLIDEQLRTLVATAQKGMDYPQRFEALTRLKNAPDDLKQVIARRSMANAGQAMNDAEAYYYTTTEDRAAWDAPAKARAADAALTIDLKNKTRGEAFASLMGDIETAWGTRRPEELVAGRVRGVIDSYHLKDLGFIKGDITKKGILQVDPAGVTAVQLLPDETILRLQKRAEERGIYPKRESQHTAALAEVEARLSDLARRNTPEVQTFSPEAAAMIGPTTGAFLALSDQLSRIQAGATRLLLAADEGAGAIGLDLPAKKFVEVIAQDPRLARDVKTPVQAAAIVLDMATETGNLLGNLGAANDAVNRADLAAETEMRNAAAFGDVLANPPARLRAMGLKAQARDQMKATWNAAARPSQTPTEVDGDAFRDADPALLRAALSETNQAVRLVGMGAREAELDQDVRTRRMAEPGAYSKNPLGYMKDVAATMAHQIGATARETFATIIDNPEQLALVVAGEKLGDATFAGMARARTSIFKNFYNGAKLREAGNYLGRYFPAKVDEILTELRGQITRAGNHAGATEALDKATGYAMALQKEVAAGVAKNAVDPSTGAVRLFSKSLADVLQLPGINAPKAVQTVLDHIGYKPTTGEIANLLRSAASFLAKKPNRLSVRMVDATAQAAEDAVLKYTSRLLGESSDPEKYVNLQLEKDRLTAAGDVAGAEAVSKRLAKFQSPNGRGASGPIDALKLANERDNLVEGMRDLNNELEAARRTFGREPTEFNKANLALSAEKAQAARKRIDEIGTQLYKAPKLDAVDVAQLMIAKDTGKLRYSFFTEARGYLHDKLSQLFGAGNFEEIRRAADAADRAFSFDGDAADTWSAEKAQQAVVKTRNQKLYDATIARMDNAAEARQTLIHHARHRSQNATSPEAAALAKQEHDALIRQDIDAVAARDSLVRERRAMMSMPEGTAWSFPGSQLSRHTSMDDLEFFVRAYPEHFDFAHLERIGRTNAPETVAMAEGARKLNPVIEEKAARLAEVKAQAAKLEDELRTNPPPDPGPAPPPQIQQRTTAAGEEATAVDLNAAAARAHKAAGQEQARRIREAELAATEAEVLQGDLKRLRAEKKRLESGVTRIAREDLVAQRDLLRRFSYGGAKQELKRQVDLFRQDAVAALANRQMGNSVNPWLQGTLPLHMKGRGMGESMRLSMNMAQLNTYTLEGLADELLSRPPSERALFGRAIAEGKIPDNLADTHPDLAHQLEHMLPDQRADFDRNLERYLKYERGVQAELLETLATTGHVPRGVIDSFKKTGYDPGLYAWHGAPNIVRGGAAAELKAARPKSGGQSGLVSGDEFRFKRDHSRHRVVVTDPDGTLTEMHFDTLPAAKDWVEAQYGLAKLEKSAAFHTATTKNGTHVTIGEPLGEEALQILGFQKDMTAERRLHRFKELNMDIAVHRFLNGQQSVAGMVMTPEEFHATALRIGDRSSDFERQYLQLPAERQDKFGSMAGMYVHRKVLTEMNGMRHTFEGLQGWLESMSTFYKDFSQFAPKLFGKIPVTSQKLTDGWFQAVKFSQILLSPRTWFGNLTFNIFADQFVGGKVMAPQNWDNLQTAFAVMTGAKNRPRELLGRDMRMFNEATRHGVINGSIFRSDAGNKIHQAYLNAMSAGDQATLQSRLALLKDLRAKETAALLKRSGTSTENLKEIGVQIAATEEMLRDFEKGFMKNLGKELAGMFLNKKGARGLPLSRLGSGIRESYGMVDDVYRFAAYMNLRRGGMSAAAASQRILDFAQNYGNIPAAVSQLARSPFGSLVPAFPMELTRLVKNYATRQPLRLAAMLSVIPALNATMMGMAGVSMSRLAASARAGGNQTAAEMTNYLASTLIIPDPRNHNIASTIDLGTTFQPVGQVFSDYGALSQMAETWLPKTNDGMLANAGRVGAKFAGAYALNNPLVNGAAGFLFNKDPVTGRTLVGEGASTAEHLHAFHKLFTQSLVPSWTPVLGRAANDAQRALEAPLHPETGRPINAQELGTVLSRSLFGVALKGKLAGGGAQVNDQLLMISLMYGAEKAAGGAAYGRDLQVFGTDPTAREFWGWMRSNNPERRVEAERELRKLAAAQKEFQVNGVTYSKVGTDREEERYVDAVMNRGALDHFNSLDLRVQTAVLIEADKAQVNRSTLQSFSDAARLDQRWMEQVPGDPGQVEQAIAMIDSWAADKRSSPAAQQWRAWLKDVLELSTITYEREKIRTDITNQMKAQGVLR